MAQAAEASSWEQTVPTPGRARFAATIVLGHALKHALTSGVSSVIVPEIKLSLGLSATQVGALGTTQQFTGLFATISAGYFGDRFTKRAGLMLGVSLAMTGFALLVMGLAQTYAMLVVGMLLMGFGPSMFHPPAVGALSRRFADRRSFAISLHGTGGSLGEVIGPISAAGLLALLFWRHVLTISFVPAIVAAVLMWRILDNARYTGNDHDSKETFRAYLTSFGQLLKHRTLLLIFLVTALRAVGQSITAIFLPVYLREDLSYSPALVGLYISMSQLAGIGSQPLMGYLADRFGHKPVILPALIIFAVMLGLLPLAEGKIQLALVILALGFFVFSMQSILTSAAIEMAGESVHSTVVSMIYAASFFGSLAPAVAGILADAYGLKATFMFSFALVAVGVVVLAFTKFPQHGHARVGT